MEDVPVGPSARETELDRYVVVVGITSGTEGPDGLEVAKRIARERELLLNKKAKPTKKVTDDEAYRSTETLRQQMYRCQLGDKLTRSRSHRAFPQADVPPPTRLILTAAGDGKAKFFSMYDTLQLVCPSRNQKMKDTCSVHDFISADSKIGVICNMRYVHDSSTVLLGKSTRSSLPYPGFFEVSVDCQPSRLYHHRANARDGAIFDAIVQHNLGKRWAEIVLGNLDFVVLRRRGLEKYRGPNGQKVAHQVCLVVYRSGTPSTIKVTSFDDVNEMYGPIVMICNDM